GDALFQSAFGLRDDRSDATHFRILAFERDADWVLDHWRLRLSRGALAESLRTLLLRRSLPGLDPQLPGAGGRGHRCARPHISLRNGRGLDVLRRRWPG